MAILLPSVSFLYWKGALGVSEYSFVEKPFLDQLAALDEELHRQDACVVKLFEQAFDVAFGLLLQRGVAIRCN